MRSLPDIQSACAIDDHQAASWFAAQVMDKKADLPLDGWEQRLRYPFEDLDDNRRKCLNRGGRTRFGQGRARARAFRSETRGNFVVRRLTLGKDAGLGENAGLGGVHVFLHVHQPFIRKAAQKRSLTDN